jgi:hypothetical protein
MNLRSSLVACAALAVLATGSPAAALTVIQTETIASGATGTTTTVTFDQFDSMLGTLDSVELSFTANMPSVSGTIANSHSSQTRTYNVSSGVTAGLTGNGLTLSSSFGGQPVQSVTVGPRSSAGLGPYSGSGSDSDVLNTGLTGFVGAGDVSFLFSRTSNFSFTPMSNGTLTINPLLGGSATLTYNYTAPVVVTPPPAVPEPATWAMMIVGFGSVGAIVRRRRLTPALVRVKA